MPAVPERPRRRGRTTLLIACAALLGAVAGVCTGYVVQADREPTALPPLSLTTVAQAKGEGPEVGAPRVRTAICASSSRPGRPGRRRRTRGRAG